MYHDDVNCTVSADDRDKNEQSVCGTSAHYCACQCRMKWSWSIQFKTLQATGTEIGNNKWGELKAEPISNFIHFHIKCMVPCRWQVPRVILKHRIKYLAEEIEHKFSCHLCGKACTERRNLYQHMDAIHIDLKRFKWLFRRCSNVQRHLQQRVIYCDTKILFVAFNGEILIYSIENILLWCESHIYLI